MANTTKTYRVVRGEVLVGYSIRRHGDLVPEAGSWETLGSHLRTGTLEMIYVDKLIVDAAVKGYAIIEKKRLAKIEKAKNPTPKKVTKKIITRKKVGTNAGQHADLSEQSV